jgi:hypothetical protein
VGVQGLILWFHSRRIWAPYLDGGAPIAFVIRFCSHFLSFLIQEAWASYLTVWCGGAAITFGSVHVV